MSDKQILDIPRQLSDAGVTGNVLLQWHGGEKSLREEMVSYNSPQLYHGGDKSL
jgi:hypothetical protein